MNKYIITALSVLCSSVAFAQNLNQSVEVTNQYEGKLIEVDKQELSLTVPDSLTTFDYKFDYSVFDNPFKGSYEFHPYLMSMKPEARPYSGSSFYFRGGAGYQFAPEVQMAYSPLAKGQFRISFYDFFSGFAGNYNKFVTGDSGNDYYLYEPDGSVVDGMDMENKLGLNFKIDGKKIALTGDAAYEMVAVRDTSFWSDKSDRTNSIFNAVNFNLALDQKQYSDVFYNATAHVKYGVDRIAFGIHNYELSELIANANINIGMKMGRLGNIVIRSGIDAAIYSRTLSAYTLNPYVRPAYEFSYGPLNFSAGARISFLFSEDDGFKRGLSACEMYSKDSKHFYPDVNLSLNLFKNRMQLFASAQGFDRINTFSSLFENDHFLNPVYMKQFVPVLDNSVIPLQINAGIRGSIADYLHYDFSAMYVQYENYVSDAVFFSGAQSGRTGNTYFTYNDIELLVYNAALDFKSQRLSANAAFEYLSPVEWLAHNSDFFGICPADYQVSGSFTYNIANRIYFGANCRYIPSRYATGTGKYIYSDGLIDTQTFCVPSYLNLGANVEFKYSDNFSIWFKGENLLNQAVPVYITHSPKGLIFTAGICLNL